MYDRLQVFLAPGLPLRTPSAALGLQLQLDDELSDRKLTALRAQATQTAALLTALGEDTMRDWCSVESFIDAESAVADGSWGTWRPEA